MFGIDLFWSSECREVDLAISVEERIYQWLSWSKLAHIDCISSLNCYLLVVLRYSFSEQMQEWKKIVAGVSVIVFGGRLFLHLVMFGPALQDPEFDQALIWAEQAQIPDLEKTQNYPFSSITRAEAAIWYVRLAQDISLIPQQSTCSFEDIDDLEGELQEQIILSCQYGFFKGTSDEFHPENYLEKGSSLVALIRGIRPGIDVPEVEPYRAPYVNMANEIGITQRASSPYMSYLVTRYELLLQLYRASQQ